MHVDIYGTSRLENAGQCISHTKGLKIKKKKDHQVLVWDFPLNFIFPM